jgi:hypothetical protein
MALPRLDHSSERYSASSRKTMLIGAVITIISLGLHLMG